MWNFDRRPGHYVLLLLIWAILCLPNLGKPALWDIDEGNNAGCSQEMYESGNWIVPTINYQLRTDKPVMLYWLQMACFPFFGVNEFSARLPSALASLVTVLAVYELGRRLYRASAGLLAGVILASTVAFTGAAHFANPDALLNACTALTLLCFWCRYSGRSSYWLMAAGATTGLGMLAKGPVGLVLPVAVTGLFFLWRWQLRRWCDPALLLAVLAFLLVAAPWYIWVGVETKGEWLTGFFRDHNLHRARFPLENHRGPFYYYLLVLCVGFAPWSIFLGPTIWLALRRLRSQPSTDGEAVSSADPRAGVQFLLCWIAVYLISFSIAQTKLPNYILPLYPAVALLTASLLDAWRRGEVVLPGLVSRLSLCCLLLLGVVVSAGLLVASGHTPVSLHGRQLPRLERLAWIGGIPLVGAAVAWVCLRRQWRGRVLVVVGTTSVAFLAVATGRGAHLFDHYKAPRRLVQALPENQLRREVRVACYEYFQPSLVFYCRRELGRPKEDINALLFLSGPLPSYLFVPAKTWERLHGLAPIPARVIRSRHDLYTNEDILVVTNEEVSPTR
jgi:4-amino-4-deoxy-L-arabinose transferase-like glycosyltransferase